MLGAPRHTLQDEQVETNMREAWLFALQLYTSPRFTVTRLEGENGRTSADGSAFGARLLPLLAATGFARTSPSKSCSHVPFAVSRADTA